MKKLKFTKVRDVKSPIRAHETDAGIDFFVPEGDSYILKQNESILIPSGIKVNIPKNHVLIAFNKSGIATKKSLLVGACVIDEDYQGEIHINLHNVGTDNQTIEPGDKIVQFLLLPINYAELEELDNENLYSNISSRGDGGFGSTGEK